MLNLGVVTYLFLLGAMSYTLSYCPILLPLDLHTFPVFHVAYLFWGHLEFLF